MTRAGGRKGARLHRSMGQPSKGKDHTEGKEGTAGQAPRPVALSKCAPFVLRAQSFSLRCALRPGHCIPTTGRPQGWE